MFTHMITFNLIYEYTYNNNLQSLFVALHKIYTNTYLYNTIHKLKTYTPIDIAFKHIGLSQYANSDSMNIFIVIS